MLTENPEAVQMVMRDGTLKNWRDCLAQSLKNNDFLPVNAAIALHDLDKLDQALEGRLFPMIGPELTCDLISKSIEHKQWIRHE